MKIVGVLIIVGIVFSVLAERKIEIDGIGYLISDANRKNWHAAFRYCYEVGMYLIDFETFGEHQKVTEYLQKNHQLSSETYWTSGTSLGTKRKSEFYWAITGVPLQFNGFGPGQPDNAVGNEYCVEMRRQFNFQWNDTPCRDKKSFICRATRYFKLVPNLSADPIH